MNKRLVLLFACFLLCVYFVGCSNKEPVKNDFSTTIDGQSVVITFSEDMSSEGTVTAENGMYTFSYGMDGTFFVIYPNGYAYSHKNLNGGIASSWPYEETASELGYLDGFDMERAIQAVSSSKSANAKTVPPILSILITGLGIWFVWKPKVAWWIARGWMFKNVEPSDIALTIYSVAGIVFIFVGIVSFFV